MFLTKALSRAGAEELVTPREIMRDFITLLNIIRDNPGATFDKLINNIAFSDSKNTYDDLTAEEVVSTVKTKVDLFDFEI